MIIEVDSLVTIMVKMYDLQGNLLEETGEEGITYLHGHEDIFPAMEKKLEGRKPGETVTLTLEPEEAFGEFDPEAIFLVDTVDLGDPETVVPGLVYDHVPGRPSDGRRYRVDSVAENRAVLDANHPLAGWTLKFEVSVLDVSRGEGEVTGNDETVVPSFLKLADKIIDDETD